MDGFRARPVISGAGVTSAALLVAAGASWALPHANAVSPNQPTTQSAPEAVQYGLVPGGCDQRISTLAVANFLGDKVNAEAGACLPVASSAHESVETWRLNDGGTLTVQVSDKSAFGLSPHNPAALPNDYWVMMSQVDDINRVSPADKLSIPTMAGTMTGAVVSHGSASEAIGQVGDVQIIVDTSHGADMPSPSRVSDFLANVAGGVLNPVPQFVNANAG